MNLKEAIIKSLCFRNKSVQSDPFGGIICGEYTIRIEEKYVAILYETEIRLSRCYLQRTDNNEETATRILAKIIELEKGGIT